MARAPMAVSASAKPPLPLSFQKSIRQQQQLIQSQSQSNQGTAQPSTIQTQSNLAQKYEKGELSQSEFNQLFSGEFSKYGQYSDKALNFAYAKYYQQTSPNVDYQSLQSFQALTSSLPKEIKQELGGSGLTPSVNITKAKTVVAQPVFSGYEGGFSSIHGGEGGFSQEVIVTKPIQYTGPASVPNLTASSIQGKDFFIESTGKVVKPIASYVEGGIITEELPKSKQTLFKKEPLALGPEPSYEGLTIFPEGFLDTVPFHKRRTYEPDKYLQDYLSDFGLREKIERRLLTPLTERRLKRKESQRFTPRDEFGLYAKKGRELGEEFTGGILISGLVTSATIFADPQKTARDVEFLGRDIFSFKEIKGVQQLVADPQKVGSYQGLIAKQIEDEPAFFAGGLIGGGIFDKLVGGPILRYASRPAVNIYSQARLAAKGIDVGVVEGTTGVSFFRTKENLQFLLVEDIHTKLPQVPGVGDLPLTKLIKQTKAGTGEPIVTGSFVSGALTRGTRGDKFLVREFEKHYGGIQSAGLFAAPELVLEKDLIVGLSSGKKLVVPKGETLGVGAKQFASDLVQATNESYQDAGIQLFKESNTLLVGKEAVKLPRTKGLSTLEVSKRFYGKEFSGKFAIAPQEILPKGAPVATEREILAQAQRLFPYKSRGTILGFKELNEFPELPQAKSFPIYSRKPFFQELSSFFPEEVTYRPMIVGVKSRIASLEKRFPNFERLYEDIGFGREYKEIKVAGVGLSVPVGRPPKLTEFAERPRVGALITRPMSDKILFVKEGNQPFLFPGGGVEPVLVPGQGKEGIRLAYPKNFVKDLDREVFEETGLVLKKVKLDPLIQGVRSPVTPLRPLIGRGRFKKPAFLFQDIGKVYDASPIFFRPKPSGEITKIGLFTPEEALAKDIGFIERKTLEKMIQKPVSVSGRKVIGFDLDQTLVFRKDGKRVLRTGIEDTLRGLRKEGFELQVFTYSRYPRAQRVLKEAGLDKYFKRVVSREQYAFKRGENTLKDIRRFGMETLVEDRPQQVSNLAKHGLKGFLVKPDPRVRISTKDIVSSLNRKRKPAAEIMGIKPSDYDRMRPASIAISDEFRRYTPTNLNRFGARSSKKENERESRRTEEYRRFYKVREYRPVRYEREFPRYETPRENRRPLRRELSYSYPRELLRPIRYPRTPEEPYRYPEPINRYGEYRIPERPRVPSRPPEEPRPRVYPKLDPFRFARIPKNQQIDSYTKGLAPGFVTVLFRKGKPIKQLSDRPLIESEAIALGAKGVDEPILRSFKIFRRGVARPIGIRGPIGILRRGKRDPSLLVERSRFAISTRGEKTALKIARQQKIGGLLNKRSLLGKI